MNRTPRTARPRAGRARRTIASALALACLGGAQQASAKNYEGSVLLPVLHPTIAREAYNLAPGTNGIFGRVVRLNPSVTAGTEYTIRDDSGRAGTDFDVYWYPNLAFGTAPCPISEETPGGPNRQHGVVRCDADYAIVVLFSGLAADFTSPSEAHPPGKTRPLIIDQGPRWVSSDC